MSTVIAYQRLFEVRILHEYYLLGANILSYFDLPAANRNTIFRNRVLWNQYRLSDDLVIEPDEKTQTLLKGLQWRFLQTTAGFAIAAATKPAQLLNGTSAAKPKIAPPVGAQLLFRIRPQNPLFQNFTALPLRKKTPHSIYYLTNSSLSTDGADFASLSAPVSPIEASKPYEMGELARVGGVLKEALQNTDGNNTTTHWRNIGGDGYLNENDRICLPKSFQYPFAAADNIQTTVFTLEKPDGTPLPPCTVKGDGITPITLAAVRFTPTPPDGYYQLKINAGAIQKNLDVFLTDAYETAALGVVHLNLDESDLTYRLLGAEGEIRNENPDPNGKPLPPVFEIRLRSRRTIWRYLSYFNTRRIKPNNLPDHLKQEGDTAVTLTPQPFTLLPLGVSSPTTGVNPVSLPKADPAALKPRPPDLLYADIRTFRATGLTEEPI